jgi:hypothetical protein
MSSPLRGIDRVLALAEPLAGAWAARANAATTVGRERATVRLFGVSGLDREGRPLAWSVVDRWLASEGVSLGSGIALPFTLAMLEYEQSAQEVALDVASGAIDLGLEARMLLEGEPRANTEAAALRLGRSALERIDANRTARRELLDVLGDAPTPWLAGEVGGTSTLEAIGEAARLVLGGADIIRVAIPTGRELAMRLLDLGLEAPDARLGESLGQAADEDVPGSPAGSQRGLGSLRATLDEVAAERGAYVRLSTAAPPLSAPEQAVVAAFERVDMVEADPFTEIVEGGVDPDRAIADHAFAHRLHRRGGTALLLGAGPLVVGPELTRGMPETPAVRSGRALALQVVAARLAVANGMFPADVAVGGVPAFVLEEPDAAVRSVAEVAVRRALLPGHRITFGPPPDRGSDPTGATAALWSHLVGALLPIAAPTAAVLRRDPVERFATAAADHRAAVLVARATAEGLGSRTLKGLAAGHASDMLEEAANTLEALRDEGWRAVLGATPAPMRPSGMGADAVAERTESLDPFA